MRGANDGITALIAADGRVMSTTPAIQAWRADRYRATRNRTDAVCPRWQLADHQPVYDPARNQRSDDISAAATSPMKKQAYEPLNYAMSIDSLSNYMNVVFRTLNGKSGTGPYSPSHWRKGQCDWTIHGPR